jgi:hypothetical protein
LPSGEHEVPRTVLLACKGWEVERQAAAGPQGGASTGLDAGAVIRMQRELAPELAAVMGPGARLKCRESLGQIID